MVCIMIKSHFNIIDVPSEQICDVHSFFFFNNKPVILKLFIHQSLYCWLWSGGNTGKLTAKCHNTFHRISSSHSFYHKKLPYYTVITFMHKRKLTAKFATMICIRFLPYIGFYSKNPLYYTLLHTWTKAKIYVMLPPTLPCYTALHIQELQK